MTAPRRRVVLVEDDVAIRWLVAMALQPLGIELVECASVAAAVQALRERPAHLVVTDLGLPDEPGTALIERLAADPALRGPARIAVFTGTMDDALRERLQRLGVWRIVPKAPPLRALEDCVRAALADADADVDAGAGAGADADASALLGSAADEQEAVAHHFGGDAGLYAEFKRLCLARFPADVAEGDRACREGDGPALQRTVHALKTVLRSLGYVRLSALAAAIEQEAVPTRQHALWNLLRVELVTLSYQ